MEIQNVVSTANLGVSLKLEEIKADNIKYNPQKFGALILKLKQPKATALIFHTGKIVCTGAKSQKDSQQAAWQVAELIISNGYKLNFSQFKIQNIVCSFSVNAHLRLDFLYQHWAKHCTYEPEIFPALVFRLPQYTALIFTSGKVIFTGAKQLSALKQGHAYFIALLDRYKRS